MTRKPYSQRGKERGSTPFGDRIKQERLRCGLTLHAFANKVGCDVSQVTAAENRGVTPHFWTVVAMAQVLDCSIDYLAGIGE